MKLYVVYNTDDDGFRLCVDSYWLDYSIAVARFKKYGRIAENHFKVKLIFMLEKLK